MSFVDIPNSASPYEIRLETISLIRPNPFRQKTTYPLETLRQPVHDDIEFDTSTSVSLRIEEYLGMHKSIGRDSLEVSVRERIEIIFRQENVHRRVEISQEVVERAEVFVSVSPCEGESCRFSLRKRWN